MQFHGFIFQSELSQIHLPSWCDAWRARVS